jgi:hypothetical protein
MQYSNCGISVPAAYASPDRTHSRTSFIRTLVRSFKIETLTSAREIDAADDANLQPQKSLLHHDNVSSSRAAMDRSFYPVLCRDMLFIHCSF